MGTLLHGRRQNPLATAPSNAGNLHACADRASHAHLHGKPGRLAAVHPGRTKPHVPAQAPLLPTPTALAVAARAQHTPHRPGRQQGSRTRWVHTAKHARKPLRARLNTCSPSRPLEAVRFAQAPPPHTTHYHDQQTHRKSSRLHARALSLTPPAGAAAGVPNAAAPTTKRRRRALATAPRARVTRLEGPYDEAAS